MIVPYFPESKRFISFFLFPQSPAATCGTRIYITCCPSKKNSVMSHDWSPLVLPEILALCTAYDLGGWPVRHLWLSTISCWNNCSLMLVMACKFIMFLRWNHSITTSVGASPPRPWFTWIMIGGEKRCTTGLGTLCLQTPKLHPLYIPLPFPLLKGWTRAWYHPLISGEFKPKNGVVHQFL